MAKESKAEKDLKIAAINYSQIAKGIAEAKRDKDIDRYEFLLPRLDVVAQDLRISARIYGQENES